MRPMAARDHLPEGLRPVRVGPVQVEVLRQLPSEFPEGELLHVRIGDVQPDITYPVVVVQVLEGREIHGRAKARRFINFRLDFHLG